MAKRTNNPACRKKKSPSGLDPALQRRVVIEHVRPQVDCGRFPIKRVVGERVVVRADVFADGHDVVAAVLLYRKSGDDSWREAPMTALGNDEWTASFTVEDLGRYEYTVEGWVDRFASWRVELSKKAAAGQVVASELLEGAALVDGVGHPRAGEIGGLLRDVDGHRFMPDYEPEKKELASRDVVSRRMEEHIGKGKGVASRFGTHLWIDITLLGEHHIKHNLREVYEICHYFLGIDPVTEWVPVRPAQHYTMGGVRTNHTGESPTLKGLFSAGEAACWDMHGFNRLGGNSVAETVVAGMIVGEYIADFCDNSANDLKISTGLIQESLRQEQAKIDRLLSGAGTEDAAALMTQMQEVMTAKVGIFRTGKAVGEAMTELEQLLVRSRNIGLRYKARGANPELVTAYRVQKMLKLALCVACGAYARTESRGAHFREDFPRRDDAQWLKRTLAIWKSETDTLPSLGYEPLDVMKMELPPGWRGYGAKDYIEHPDTPRRSAELEALKKQSNGGDRVRLQAMMMPYESLLPERFRGRNEQIDEPITENL